MFQFPRLSHTRLCVQRVVSGDESWWVYSFGNLRVLEYVLLTVAYRSLSRPSSAFCAKASTVCPYYLLLQDIKVYIHYYEVHSIDQMRSSYTRKSWLSRYAVVKVHIRSEPPKPNTASAVALCKNRQIREKIGLFIKNEIFTRWDYSP